MVANTKYISECKSKGLSDESIEPLAKSNNSLSPLIDYLGNKIRLKLTGSCLKQQNRLTYTHRTIVNIYIEYELGASGYSDNDPTLKNVYLVQLH